MTHPKTQSPLVSIGLPVRNGEPYVTTMIDSILAQTFTDFELIISDNCSTDKTREICASYAASDARVRFHPLEKNIGAAPNHNRVVELARGRFFKYTGHDDILAPTFLERCLEALNAAPEAVVAYPRTLFIDAEGAPLGEDTVSLDSPAIRPETRLKQFFHRISYINPLYGVIRTDALRKTRLEGSFLKSDQVLIAELLMLGRFTEVPETLFYRRLHPGRSMQANPTRASLTHYYNPQNRLRRLRLPVQLRLTLEYLRSSLRVPARFSDRVRCAGVTLRCHSVPRVALLSRAACRRLLGREARAKRNAAAA